MPFPESLFSRSWRDYDSHKGYFEHGEVALRSMQRCFRIYGGLERPFLTTDGFPEGDPLSVVPMVLTG